MRIQPFSTFDDVCAALVTEGIVVYASYEEDLATYQRHIKQTLESDQHLVMDDGADLIVALHCKATATSVLLTITFMLLFFTDYSRFAGIDKISSHDTPESFHSFRRRFNCSI